VQNCAEGGVFGVLPGLIGTMQAVETLKLILGVGEPLIGQLLMLDALTMHTRIVHFDRDPQCPACGTRTITRLIDYDEFCGTPSLEAQAAQRTVSLISTSDLHAQLAQAQPPRLIDVREPHETAVSIIAGAQLIPLGALSAAIPTLQRDADIVVMCRSGKRSADAARQLQDAGFTRVRSLDGGILRWLDDGLAVVPSSGA
jgi:sulfur-carrier protein adenylyltransferase/sulfurtransferase